MKSKNERGPMSITFIDYSEALDMLAYCGGQGKLCTIDATSKKKVGSVQAHTDEIVHISFYD